VKRILVALDASPRAPAVLFGAARLADLTDAKLVLFRAIAVPQDLPREMFHLLDTRLEDVLKRGAREDLERLARGTRPAVVEAYVCDFATAWDGICRAAQKHDADLIVIGSHGFGGIDHLLGTTAAKVVNHADRNVLVVRTPL
jgi:nucleotide-binding universal stress UspA family protein